MAVYTKFSLEDIEDILVNYRLTLRNYHMIKNGILNTNYYLECLEGRFILRIFEGGRKFEEEEKELEFLLNIKEIIPCCIPIKTIENKNYIVKANKMVAIFKFIEGEAIKIVNEKLLTEIGEYLGKLHRYSSGKLLIRKSRIDMENYYNKIDFNFIPISAMEKIKIRSLYEEVKHFDFSKLPGGIIHNDIFPDNVFIKNGSIVGILDFNESQTAPFIYDLAIVINYWIRINNFNKQTEERYTEIFINSYEKYRRLELQEKRALNKALKKMAITFILLRFDKFIIQNLEGVLIEDKNYTQLLPLLKYY
ncbi:homoserine kinase [Fusobacterium sp.]|uniref:homoserine kinase n=1 Tax=Fusobacterium sp. TaxID=68766 RepID=UPI00262D8BA9|nr:homoserine kinase [Fusobacterium sp.]